MKYLLIIVVVYISVSFVRWEINPAQWDEGARFGCIACILLSCLLSLGVEKDLQR